MSEYAKRATRRVAAAVLLGAGLLGANWCAAMDRGAVRFQRLLTGRHDAARTAAMQSLPRDFRSRLNAFPVVAAALQELADEPRFDRAAERDEPDLPGGVRMMIDFVGTVEQPEATETLIELLDCGRQSWTMAAIETLSKYRRHDAIEAIVEQMDSDWFESSYGFRFVLARGLKNMRHPKAWDALALLYDRVDGQLAFRLHQEFRGVTVDEFGGDREHFTAWRGRVGLSPEPVQDEADALARAANILAGRGEAPQMPKPKRSGLAPSASAAAYTRGKLTRPSHYYGIEIHAKRLLFVIDRSDSMKTVVSGLSRIVRAKRELITAINGLDPQCEFSVLVFDREVRAWRSELVPATESNKRQAAQFVEYLSAGSTTNTYAALRQALEFDDQLEAVFLLTDGQPTTGRIVSPKAILLDILRRNELNNLTLNAVAIAVEPEMVTFLQNLAEPSGGEFRRVD